MLILITLLVALFSGIYLIGQRLLWGPLSHIPGPKLAALSGLYEFYYDVVSKGRFTWKINELHDRYGEIVRISPVEVHIRDSSFLDSAFPLSHAHPVEKWPPALRMFGSRSRAEATKTQAYRNSLPGKFFSKTAANLHATKMQARLRRLVARLHPLIGTGAVVNLTDVIGGLMQDFILELCFGYCHENVDAKDFGSRQYHMNLDPLRWIHFYANIFPLMHVVEKILSSILRLVAPELADLPLLRQQWRSLFQEMLASKDEQHNTLFAHLYRENRSLDMPGSEERLIGEAAAFVGAGSLTPTEAIKNTIYFVFADERVRDLAVTEIEQAFLFDDVRLELEKLQKLPYLSAIIHESLRLGHGVPHRLQRVHKQTSILYKSPTSGLQYLVPAGTPVGMTSSFVCEDPAKFPKPREFLPERWTHLSPLEQIKTFQDEMMVFGKGSRNCVGINIAYAAMYTVVGTWLRQYGNSTRLLDVERARDIDVSHDFFIAGVNKASPGLLICLER